MLPVDNYELGLGDPARTTTWATRLNDGTAIVAPNAAVGVTGSGVTTYRFNANTYVSGAWSCVSTHWAFDASAPDHRGDVLSVADPVVWELDVEGGEHLVNRTDSTFGHLFFGNTALKVVGRGLWIDAPAGDYVIHHAALVVNDSAQHLQLDFDLLGEEVVELTCAPAPS